MDPLKPFVHHKNIMPRALGYRGHLETFHISQEHYAESLRLLRAYRHLETYARERGAGMLLVQLQPLFSIIQDDLRHGRTKMTR